MCVCKRERVCVGGGGGVLDLCRGIIINVANSR